MSSENKDSTKFNKEAFKNPPMANRGIPFWSWNSTLDDKEKLRRQIGYFKDMGFGGFMMHSRTGLKSEYLGKEFMEAVKFCTEEAEKQGMYAWLYDEDRWPSGYAGGFVLKEDISLCIRYLQFNQNEQDVTDSEEEGLAKGIDYFVAAYDVEVDDDGNLASYKRIGRHDKARFQKWYAFSKRTNPDGWFNGSTYIDPLNPDAIKKFLEITHERYYKTIGEYFGKVAPAVFFDEPALAPSCPLPNSKGNEPASIAWSYTIPKYFKEKYGYDILDKLPEMFWQLPGGKLSKVRHDMWDTISERYAVTYNDQIADWCRKHNIKSTGHYLREEECEAQILFNGDLMRQYRSMDIPGMDALGVGEPEPIIFQQVRSVARQYGRKDIACEMYGVSNWEFDFRTFKTLGDWMASFGVTTRIPHLAYLSMEGEGKRDFPASIHYQSPWYTKFSLIEDYFARLRTVLTSGKPTTDIAVIHPIESGWMLYGPCDKTSAERAELFENFCNLNNWLIRGFIDCDLLCEALLPELCACEQSEVGLTVGNMIYKTVIVPNKTVVLRKTTVEILNKLINNGGRVVFVGGCPSCLDAEGAKLLTEVYKKSDTVKYDKNAVIEAFVSERSIDILDESGNRDEHFFFQLRNDGDKKWLFVTSVIFEKQPPKNGRKTKIVINGNYVPKVYNAFDGSIGDIEYSFNNGKTEIYNTFFAQDSLLLSLEPADGTVESKHESSDEKVIWSKKITDAVEYSLSEPNVLLLDFAEYSVDGGEFRPKKDLLKITLETKAELGLSDKGIQPWALEDKPIEHNLALKITVDSEIECADVCLGIENPSITEMIWNGVRLDSTADEGWYIDEAIRKIRLPGLKKGENELFLSMPLGVKTWAENCYLLGNFGVKLKNPETAVLDRQDRLITDYGVKVRASAVTVTERSPRITFNSIVTQGLPFYSANITYKIPVKIDSSGTLQIKADKFVGALMSVSIDGDEKGNIIYQPYTLEIPNIEPGEHTVEITVYGTRYNTLACLHLYRDTIWNADPGWFRRGGDDWTDDYRFKEFGILEGPELKLIKKL